MGCKYAGFEVRHMWREISIYVTAEVGIRIGR